MSTPHAFTPSAQAIDGAVLVVEARPSLLALTLYPLLARPEGANPASRLGAPAFELRAEGLARPDSARLRWWGGGEEGEEPLALGEGEEPITAALRAARALLNPRSPAPLAAVAHLIPRGGRWRRSALLTPALLAPLAPLNPPAPLAAAAAALVLFEGAPQVCCFNTSFHAAQVTSGEGAHGLAYQHATLTLAHITPRWLGRALIVHIDDLEEEGASACATLCGERHASSALLLAPGGAPLTHSALIARLCEELEALAQELGGLDLLALTGAACERDAALRAALCAPLAARGVALDDALNRAAVTSAAPLHAAEGDVEVWLLPTRPRWVAAVEAVSLLCAD